ncbi:unnamed protein product [Tetraodon nigroviridis]|uniref:Chromosome 9 SCAF14991, whole genome shotgun sequence n=1 Tax=Tetraodon nigroviridis TaxID=99883 RepID=Q4RW51_TETNG|nr:unnamed protein product [Tetraodon nigroviridis]
MEIITHLRMMDGKDIQANQNMQPKKKHKKSGSSIKVKEKVEHLLSAIDMDDDSSLKVQKNFICDHCYGAFRSSYHLKRHILTHTGEHSFPENVSNHYHLRRAVVLGLRAGEKPYACDACDMRFIQRYHLDRHKRVHSGEKPYQCDRCHQEGLFCHDVSASALRLRPPSRMRVYDRNTTPFLCPMSHRAVTHFKGRRHQITARP